eukprot:210389_1
MTTWKKLSVLLKTSQVMEQKLQQKQDTKVVLMEYSPNTQAQQRQILADALHQQDLADVTFCIGKSSESLDNSDGAQYGVNRFLLALISPVFRKMLFGHMTESKPNSTVYIEDMEPEIFESIVNYAYQNNPNINTNNVGLLIQACDKYQIETLTKMCLTFLSDSDESVVKNVINSAEFLKIQLNTMRIILQCEPLEIKEEYLWESVLKWAEYQSTKNTYAVAANDDELKCDDQNMIKPGHHRLYLLKSVRDLIRFGLMTGRYIAEKVAPENVLTDKELISVLLYYHKQFEDNCGAFNIALRMKPKMLPFELSFSSEWSLYNSDNNPGNTYQAVNVNSISEGCGVESYSGDAWIEADFGCLVNIREIKIAPPSNSMKGHDWDETHLNGASLNKYDKETDKWHTVQVLSGLQQRKFTKLKVNIVTSKMQLCKAKLHGKHYLGMSCWIMYGVMYGVTK